MKTQTKAILASIVVLALALCAVSGVTQAWFTDSESSGPITLTAGNLDVEVTYTKDGTTWNHIDNADDLFGKSWEPGHTEVVVLKVENKGSLTLDYTANLAILGKVLGTNLAGEQIDFSKYLEVSTIVQQASDKGVENQIGAIVLGLAFEGENSLGYGEPVPMSDIESLVKDQELFSGDSHYIVVKVDMPSHRGNEVNYVIPEDPSKIPSVTVGINILAKQSTYEEDSFDDQYDKDAEYDYLVYDLDGLKDAFENGGDVKLINDITFEKITSVEPGADVYLNMNGKTITVDENTTSNTLIWVKDGAKLTIDGNGTFDLGSVSTMAIFCPYGELVIENGTFIRDKVTNVTNATTGLFMGAKQLGCNVTINGGYFDPGYYDANAADIEEILVGTKEFTETADDIAKRGQPGDKNLVRVAIKDNVSVVLNHSGYGSFKVYGGTFVGANPAWGDEGCMLPTTPNYLRPWSYYQGALLAGQTFNENGLVIPDGYTITQSVNDDGVPVYTVNYSK